MSDNLVPSDEELFSIYANGTSEEGIGSSYDGWAALYLAGYRSGALVRPNVESDASNVAQAWGEYHSYGSTQEEFQAFEAGYAYGKRADIRVRPAWWVWPFATCLGVVTGLLAGLLTSVLT